MSRRSRNRGQPVRNTPLPFNDQSDERDSTRSSGPQFFGPSSAAPTSQSVHRTSLLDYLNELDSSPTQRFERSITRRVWGGEPHVSWITGNPITRTPSLKRPSASLRGYHLYRFLPRQAPAWRAFNALHATAPAKTRYCVQRKQRREVLFAKRLHGRHGGGRPYHRTTSSNWSC